MVSKLQLNTFCRQYSFTMFRCLMTGLPPMFNTKYLYLFSLLSRLANRIFRFSRQSKINALIPCLNVYILFFNYHNDLGSLSPNRVGMLPFVCFCK